MDSIRKQSPAASGDAQLAGRTSKSSVSKPHEKLAEIATAARGPVSTTDHVQSRESIAMAKRVNRKLDFALLPILSFLYLFNGLDRSNIGNAETQGFTRDIGASPEDLNLAVSLFFITFVLFQPPSAAVGRWLGAKHWIPIMMIGWGAITLAQAWIKGRGALIATRLLIGAFEAGFYPTAVAYLSFFYCRFDLATRIGLFYGQYAIAGAFSGSIAYGIFHLRTGPLNNWQYLFVIEGALTMLFGLIAWVWLPTGPGSAWFFSEEERIFAAERIKADNALYVSHAYSEDGVEQDRLTKRDVVETGKDWKLWYVLFFNICASVPSQAFSVFLPLVVQGLGYSSIQANLMSVPPFVCGAVGLYLFALSSDHRKERGLHIIGGILVALVGLVITVAVRSHGGKYAGLCILLFGSYVSAPLTVAWLSGNTPEPGKRALVLGVNGFGNLAGVIGAQLYRPKYKPDYHIPFYATLGFVALALAGYLAYRFTLQHVNRRKLKTMSDKTEEEIQCERTDNTRYADRKWTFIYGL
ncbi:major facilitator superfamily transporter [Emericellopsis atlantica]|uniref:Major facilitator superfamily transporter n=1 Tax=Emericellopsis atlantica TaxID=2614577 RepID=A0A9P7ZRK8_9HYPO|nr:major facilitator superfamily transporter [Emericellopsis atlantica]KAG9256930.1 major facilitator superfamily transporter [Emericellopsis atlantica]